MYMYKFSCGYVFNSLDYEPRNEMAELYGNPMLSFLRHARLLYSGTSYIPTSSVNIPN